MAVLGGATLSIYTVIEPPATVPGAPTPGWVPPADYDADRRTRARAAADRARASVPAEVLETVEVLDGDLAHALASASADARPPPLRFARLRAAPRRPGWRRVERIGAQLRVPLDRSAAAAPQRGSEVGRNRSEVDPG